MVLGFFFSGWFITKFNPRPSRLLSWNVFGGTLWAIVQIILIFNTCEIIEHHGIDRQNLMQVLIFIFNFFDLNYIIFYIAE